jgi:hypothetical protein
MIDELKVREVLARYVRATDARDGAAMARLFTADGKVEIFYARTGERIGELAGPATIAQAVAAMMEPHPPGGFSHHTTHDAIVEVDGDRATLDAQYIVFRVRSTARPAGGWPAGASGAQGSVEPIESGYYRSRLVRNGGEWQLAYHRIDADHLLAF